MTVLAPNWFADKIDNLARLAAFVLCPGRSKGSLIMSSGGTGLQYQSQQFFRVFLNFAPGCGDFIHVFFIA